MKVVILAGGYGSRLSEETRYRPKPMVEIGEKPILWHIMKEYYHYGFDEFIILLGYKQEYIKDYFNNYFIHNSDVTFDMKNNDIIIHNKNSEKWKVTLVDTGLDTMTGGRLKRVEKLLDNETFMLTYGDGVCDIDLKKLLRYHKKNKTIATITSVQVKERFGILKIDDNNKIKEFKEKKQEDGQWINGGYMVFESEIFKYLDDDSTVLERVLEKLSLENELMAYKYDGFWQCMDTLKEKIYLDNLLKENNAPWEVWK